MTIINSHVFNAGSSNIAVHECAARKHEFQKQRKRNEQILIYVNCSVSML